MRERPDEHPEAAAGSGTGSGPSVPARAGDAGPTRPAAATGTRRPRPTLRALTVESLRLGLVGFGGGLAVLGSVRDTLVARHRWITEREFAVTATVSQMLPGGAAANALAYTGLRFFGAVGAVAAYLGFILPGGLIVLALAAAYVHLGVAPRLEPMLAGLNAAVVGIVASITLQLVKSGIARPWQMAVAAGALLLALGGGASAGEVAAFGIGAGLVLDVGAKRMRLSRVRRSAKGPGPPPPVVLPGESEGDPIPPPQSKRDDLPAAVPWVLTPTVLGALGAMGVLFFRAGLGAYGGGFAIIANLHATVVSEHHWITERQFTDAVAIAKLTPGPVLLMATFVGYVARGLSGALVASVAVFAGPLLLVVGVGAWLARVRSHLMVRAGLRGLTPAVVGLMGAAALTLGQSLDGPPGLAIAAATVLTLSRFRVRPIVVMMLGAVARLALRAAGI